MPQAINVLAPGAAGTLPPAALIITNSGASSEKPLAIVVADDLAVLVASMSGAA